MENNTNITETQEVVEQEKTYTAEEVAKLVQSEADKRVASALKTQQKKYEKELSLSKLDDAAREKQMKDDRIAELESQLRDYTILQNKNEVISVLSARGLSPVFADLIAIGEDKEDAQAKIEQLDKLFKQEVANEVKKRLNSGVPQTTQSTNGTISKEQFNKMTLSQQAELYKANRELYNSLVV